MYITVQVSDRLGDNDLAGYGKALADILDRTQWSNRNQMKPMQSIFLSLETHLQHDVLQQVLCPVDTIVRAWPLALQHVRPAISRCHTCTLHFNVFVMQKHNTRFAGCQHRLSLALGMACLQPIPPVPVYTHLY